jgi:hypothetical protein
MYNKGMPRMSSIEKKKDGAPATYDKKVKESKNEWKQFMDVFNNKLTDFKKSHEEYQRYKRFGDVRDDESHEGVEKHFNHEQEESPAFKKRMNDFV